MRRGFKTEAERLAVRLRTELRIAPNQRINLDQLAAHLGVEVLSADTLVDREELEKLESLQPGCFSAATFHLPDGRVVAATNPVGTSQARRDSNLAHELAHVILRHELRTAEKIGSLTFFDCDPEQEDEANWLGGCLLLPRPLLLAEARLGVGPEGLAKKYNVSIQMAKYRLNASGVSFQIGRAKAKGNK